MAFEKADRDTIAFFESVVPRDTRVELKAMFGHKAAFVNGHMFAGTYGRSLVVRLDDGDREALLARAGATIFEPMPGRPMKGYVRLAEEAWPTVGRWLEKALAFASALPPKAAKTAPGAAAKRRAKATVAKATVKKGPKGKIERRAKR